MPNEIGDAFTEAMPAVGTPGPTYATEIEEVVAEIQDRLDKPVPLTSLASQADNTVLARVGAGSSGAPSAVTLPTLAAALPTFAIGVTGVVTGPATGPTGNRFLRDDNTWQPATVDLSAYLTSATAAATYTSFSYIAAQNFASTGDLANYVPNSRTVTAGTGLSGGGDLTANRTLNLANQATGTVMANITGGSAAPTGVTYASLVGVLPTATTDSRGMLPALSGNSAHVLAGDGTWTGLGGLGFVPAATLWTDPGDYIRAPSGTRPGLMLLNGDADAYYKGNGTWASIPDFNGMVGGLVPVGDGSSTKYLSADGTFTVPAGGGSGFPKTDVPADIRDGFDGGQQLEIKKAASVVNPPAGSTSLLRATDRPALYFRNQWGGQLQLATHPAAVRWQLWLAQYGVAGDYATNAPVSTKGTGSYEAAYNTVQGTTRLAAIPRMGLRTGTATGSVMYLYYTQYLYAVPKADGSVGGFYFKAVVPRINLAAVTSERVFYGMLPSGSVALYNAAYETIANHIGFVRKAGSDDVYLSYRGASNGGEVNLTTANANLTWAGTVASPRGLVFILEMVRENPGTLYYEIYDIDNENASRVRGLVTPSDATYFPSETLGLTWMLKSSNNSDAAAVSVWYSQVHLEQPL